MSVELDDRLVAIARALDDQSPPLTLADLDGRHAEASLVDDQIQPKRQRSLLLLAASTALVVGGVVAVLAVANNPESSTHSPSGSLSPVNTAVVEESCPRPRQGVSFITAWLSVPDDTVFVSACAFDGAMRAPGNMLPIDVYSSASGNEVIAWLYVACGLEGGFVEVGAARPTNCAELSGVRAEDTVPDDASETVLSTTVPTTPDPATSPIPPGVETPDVFVTVSGERPDVIDVRNSVEVAASFDLGCPASLDCQVQSTRIMNDTIWVAMTETEPGEPDTVVRSRVISASLSTGEVVEHLSLDGSAAAWSAGRGADGVSYAYLRGQEPVASELVAIEDGEVRVLATGVSGFRLSDDGRFLAVSFSNPPSGEYARFEITDLVDQTTASFGTVEVNAGPGVWSPDGRYLIVNEQWEDGTAWVIDPWSGSGEPIAPTDRFLDGACFMNEGSVAHRTWNVGYGQGDA